MLWENALPVAFHINNCPTFFLGKRHDFFSVRIIRELAFGVGVMDEN